MRIWRLFFIQDWMNLVNDFWRRRKNKGKERRLFGKFIFGGRRRKKSRELKIVVRLMIVMLIMMRIQLMFMELKGIFFLSMMWIYLLIFFLFQGMIKYVKKVNFKMFLVDKDVRILRVGCLRFGSQIRCLKSWKIKNQ